MKKELEYKVARIITTLFVAFGFALGIAQAQTIVSLAVLAAGLVILQVLRARYKSVILSDERTKRINEKAALSTFWFFMISGVLIILSQLILDFAGIEIQQLKAFTEPLSYLILGLMLVHSVLAAYYSRKM